MPTALITGASSGIGEAFAHLLAEQKYHLVLVARREERLHELAKQVRERGESAEVLPVDLLSEKGISTVKSYIQSHTVDLLINNAGFGQYGQIVENDEKQEEELIRLNILALTTLTRTALKKMGAQNKGRIIQVASLVSFFPVAYMGTYAASKAYVLHYTEALYEELKGSNITVTALCPGSTQSEFAQQAGFRQNNVMSAQEVARQGLRASEQGRPFIITGASNWLLTFLARLLPRRLMTKVVAFSMKKMA